MIKKHRITGLFYFCKTSRRDPLRYIGSGRYWKNHIRKHGKHIDTIWHKKFLNHIELTNYALFISHYFDVVNSKDIVGNKTWANLEIENGINGMPLGTDRGEQFKKHCAIINKGNRNPSYGKYWWTNGIDSIKSSECPNGWVRGVGIKFREKATPKLESKRTS